MEEKYVYQVMKDYYESDNITFTMPINSEVLAIFFTKEEAEKYKNDLYFTDFDGIFESKYEDDGIYYYRVKPILMSEYRYIKKYNIKDNDELDVLVTCAINSTLERVYTKNNTNEKILGFSLCRYSGNDKRINDSTLYSYDKKYLCYDFLEKYKYGENLLLFIERVKDKVEKISHTIFKGYNIKEIKLISDYDDLD